MERDTLGSAKTFQSFATGQLKRYRVRVVKGKGMGKGSGCGNYRVLHPQCTENREEIERMKLPSSRSTLYATARDLKMDM